MNIKRAIYAPLLITSVLLLSGCLDDDDDNTTMEEESLGTVYDIASSSDDFETLTTAIDTAGLATALDDETATYTVFAPTDDAFALLGEDTINALLADPDTLAGILTYHVLTSEVNAEAAIAAAGGAPIETLNGANIGLSLDGENLLINTSTVTMTDIATDNGVIHVLDAVLLPPTPDTTNDDLTITDIVVASESFTILEEAVVFADLAGALADETASYTVFAPTDAAFEALLASLGLTNITEVPVADLTNILLEHVVDGAVDSVTAYTLNGLSADTLGEDSIPVVIDSTADTLTVGGATVTDADIIASNGIIHVIDTVIITD